MKNITPTLLLFSSLLLPSFVYADNQVQSSVSNEADGSIVKTSVKSIQIPLSGRPTSNVLRPSKSMSQNRVIENFGHPIKKHPAKGKPPITRWDYPEYSVYFESNSVIHSVVRSN